MVQFEVDDPKQVKGITLKINFVLINKQFFSRHITQGVNMIQQTS